MKQFLLLAALLAGISSASAQERLSREEALKFAFLVSLDLKQLQGTPIPSDPDVKRPVVFRDGDYGCLLLPETKLTVEALGKAGKEPLLIGQLWLHKLAPMFEGRPVDATKLRMAKVKSEDGAAAVPQCTLAVRKNGEGTLELLVFGKDKEPILRAPMKAVTGSKDYPIDMSADKRDDGGVITLNILGAYETTFMVTDPERY